MQPNEPEVFTDPTRELQERFAPQLQAARHNLEQANYKVAAFIRENPGTCLLGALAVGFVVGKIVSRR
jgi:ElaB/YqjD/DUF883 family membrane-anchored ribosome-binding protein